MFALAPFLIQLVIGIGLQIIGYLIMGTPKQDKPESVKDMEAPTAEEGRPIPVLFGEMEITGLNIIWWGQKETHTYDTSA